MTGPPPRWYISPEEMERLERIQREQVSLLDRALTEDQLRDIDRRVGDLVDYVQQIAAAIDPYRVPPHTYLEQYFIERLRYELRQYLINKICEKELECQQ